MTQSPPHTLNFHNWLLTMKLQGTFETREESKNTSASTYSWLRRESQPAMIPLWFCTATNQEQLHGVHRETSAEMRGGFGLALRNFTAFPAHSALGVTKESPCSIGWHFPLLQHFPHTNKLTWLICSGEHCEGQGSAGQVPLLSASSTGVSRGTMAQAAPQISRVAPNSYGDQKKSVLKGKSCSCK